MAVRNSISKRTRFEIFKRDGFVCQYCGAHPPDILLEIEHIKPIKWGGKNEPDNLVAACEACNRGKAAIPLSSVPISLSAKAAQIAEREEQLRGYYAIIDAQRARINDEIWEVIWEFDETAKTFRHDWIGTIKRFLNELDRYTVLDAMQIARTKMVWNENRRFKYFCGICWNKLNEKQKVANG